MDTFNQKWNKLNNKTKKMFEQVAKDTGKPVRFVMEEMFQNIIIRTEDGEIVDFSPTPPHSPDIGG